jgi:hypothetical protein
MNPRLAHILEIRAYEIGLAASTDPLKQLPMDIAMIPEIDPFQPIPRLRSMLTRYNMDQFDRLIEKGYMLNYIKGEYEKSKH